MKNLLQLFSVAGLRMFFITFFPLYKKFTDCFKFYQDNSITFLLTTIGLLSNILVTLGAYNNYILFRYSNLTDKSFTLILIIKTCYNIFLQIVFRYISPFIFMRSEKNWFDQLNLFLRDYHLVIFLALLIRGVAIGTSDEIANKKFGNPTEYPILLELTVTDNTVVNDFLKPTAKFEIQSTTGVPALFPGTYQINVSKDGLINDIVNSLNDKEIYIADKFTLKYRKVNTNDKQVQFISFSAFAFIGVLVYRILK